MKTDIIIVGAGIVGMSLALALRGKNKKIIILEKNLENSLKINRVYSISERTKSFFQNIGIWNNIKDINNLSGMSIYYRDFSDKNMISFNRRENNIDIGYIAQSKNIMLALLEKLKKDKDINLLDNTEITKIDNINEKAIININKDESIEAEYIFSCEGSNSIIKKKLEIDNTYDDYDSKAIVFNIEHEILNNDIAHQIFLETGPVAFLPINENNFSMVVTIKNEFFNEEKFCESNICSFIQDISNSIFGKIKLTSKLMLFDLIGFDSETYKLNNVIFVGDSAHSVHPLAGMGLNLGISDIIEIMHIMINSKKSFSNKNYFSGYARKQKIINRKARQQLKFIEKIYSTENEISKKIIKIGMSSIEKSNYLKEKIIKHANNNLNFF